MISLSVSVARLFETAFLGGTPYAPDGGSGVVTHSRRPLLPLVLSATPAGEVDGPGNEPASAATHSDDLHCAFCGVHSGHWQRFVASLRRGHDRVAVCPLCLLPQHLERPSIDGEAVLVWLPEMSQAALNMTMREIHIELRGLGEDLHDAERLRLDTRERQRLYRARAAISARSAAAAARLGTDKPSELAGALFRLSPGAYAKRARLLGGVRLLALGRFWDGGRDVYPEIVDVWRELAQPHASLLSSRPAPPPGA
jgi:intracellular multiplication protein IcmJ